MAEKFETQFEKIVGGSEEDKVVAREFLQKLLNDANDLPPKVKKYELPKTKEDLDLIAKTENQVYAMIREYGGEPKLMPQEKIHLVSDVNKVSGGKYSEGYHSPMGQDIVVEKGGSELKLVGVLAHEFFHKGSYKSAQIYEVRRPRDFFRKKGSLKLKRAGIKIIERSPTKRPGHEFRYFEDLEEAIVSRMTDLFVERNLRTDEKYKKSFEDMDKIKRWLEKTSQMFSLHKEMSWEILEKIPFLFAIEGAKQLLDVLYGSKDDDYKLGYLSGYLRRASKEGRLLAPVRTEEKKEMDRLLGLLVEKGVYGSKEEAFTAFARANFSGKLLPLARQIEGILGSGSLRKIAEKFKDRPHKSWLNNLINYTKFR